MRRVTAPRPRALRPDSAGYILPEIPPLIRAEMLVHPVEISTAHQIVPVALEPVVPCGVIRRIVDDLCQPADAAVLDDPVVVHVHVLDLVRLTVDVAPAARALPAHDAPPVV